MAPTLKEIARLSGVSIATVSYVVNNGPRPVLPATREKVQRIIDELNYRPNAAARGLLGKRTNTIGVVFPHQVQDIFGNAYFSPVLSGIVDSTTVRHFATMLFTGFEWEEAELNIPMYCDGRCDGIVLIAPPSPCRLIAELESRHVPLVVIGTRPPAGEWSVVDVDNVEGARLAVGHLLDLGHRRVGLIGSDPSSTSWPERERGYRLAFGDRGLEVEETLVVPADNWDALDVAMRKLLDRSAADRPTAVFAAQDKIAEMVIRAAGELGLRVPEDMSVVGFDDLSFAAGLNPPLTTIRQPLRHVGAAATQLLLDQLDGRFTGHRQILLDVLLVQRSSTSKPSVST